MEVFVWVVHVLAAIGVIVLVLLQHGKGADMGAAFGSGASGTLFGASGSSNLLSRSTAILATVFFITSLTLAFFSHSKTQPAGLMDKHSPVTQAAPATAKPAAAGAATGANDSGSKAREIPN